LNGAVNEILLAARALGTRFWQDQGHKPMTKKQFSSHLEQMAKYERIFWSAGDDDHIAETVQAAIRKVEAIAKREVDAVRRRSVVSRLWPRSGS
jgi:hypothetical protein